MSYQQPPYVPDSQPILTRPAANGLATTSMLSGIVSWALVLVGICLNVIMVFFTAVTMGIGGILGFCLIPLYCLPPIGWLVSVITGHVAKGQIKQTGQEGSGRATAGLIMGYIGIGLIVLGICVSIVLTVLGIGISLPFLTDPSLMNPSY